jgi:pimeloyl-ACP methyl ester carboxylesterase
MSTSTGGTTALVLAGDFPDDVHALINMSPNIAINDPNAWILNNHWGLQIAHKVIGGDYIDVHFDSTRQKYWNGKYRVEAAVQLQEMIESKMNKETFKKVLCPSLTLYYYKSEKEQDPTVKVSAMLKMNEELGTPEPFKQTVAIPEAGAHVIGSYLVSKDLKSVEEVIDRFAIEKLKMQPLN